MLAGRDMFEEIKEMEDIIETLKSPYERANLKAQTLVLKMLHSIRANQTAIMNAQGIKLKESRKETAV